MSNWDDVRYVLALARTGSIRKAALSLEVNHTTVARRISALETRLSARLFEKTPVGYVLTASGRIISKAAENMEDELVGSQRKIEGADIEVSGEVHISIPDILDSWVTQALACFSRHHPKLTIHLTSQSAVADLSRREADISIRFTESPPQDMVGRKLCTMPVALYANVDYDIDPVKDFADYPWIRWAPPFRHSPPEQAAERLCNASSSKIFVTTYQTISNLIRNGAGIGFLTPWFAADDAKLKRISPIVEEGAMEIWLLTHPDLRGIKRIQATTDLLKQLFASKLEQLSKTT